MDMDNQQKNNFNENGFTYIICGDNTFVIKEELKEIGFRFSAELKWHINKEVSIPDGYHLIQIHFDEVYEWNETYCNAYPFAAAKAKIEDRMRIYDKPSLSTFIGQEGDRIKELEVVFVSHRGFESRYGWTNLYSFKRGEDILIWFTRKDLDLEEGQSVLLTGTVKKHDEYLGVKNTQLSRCIIKSI